MAQRTLNDRAREFWQSRSPKAKQYITYGVAAVVLVVLLWPLVDSPVKAPVARKPNDYSTVLTGTNPRDLGLTAVNSEVSDQGNDIKQMQAQLERLNQLITSGAPPAVTGLREQLNDIAGQVNELRRGGAPSGGTSAPPADIASTAPATAPIASPMTSPPAGAGAGAVPTPASLRSAAAAMPATPAGPPRIVTVDRDADDLPAGEASKAKAETKPAKADVPSAYIPSGSMLTGVLINGMDAPTGRGASGQPQPVLIRIKREAILPNRFRADVRECFVIAAGFGDLSSERAYLRSEAVSCVRYDGKVIDTKLEMYAVGEDGKSGLRGRLVSKQGQAIAKAMVAGFAQAYSQALQPQYGGVYGSQVGSNPLSGDTAQAGMYGGVASGLDRVSKFYVDLANQMFPVVEVDAGRPITLIVLHGGELALAHH